ncbi:lytic transglycosylase domain-containing protein [Piscinibacter terrae]|uniref:lytic transglycosylase domain-containing protein n=1 Tax=Piscinibacter terrae TaxID=2496871 RepID=UPI0013869895|nr:lytic transglycosylase domain-containing protein [Albitalea terrae]
MRAHNAPWQWALILLVCGIAGPVWADTGECDAAIAKLPVAQRSKFSLAASACHDFARANAVRTNAPQADAVVMSDRAGAARRPAVPEPVSRELQLFDTDRTPATGGDASPAPVSRVVLPPLAAISLPTSTATRRNGSAGARAIALSPDIDEVARRHDIDPLLLHAIAHVESRHNTAARSHAGAQGVMQVMPATAQRFGVDGTRALYEPRTNLEVSAAYLKSLQERFGNNLTLVLAAYNAGEGAVEKHGRQVPPYAETRSYVRQVLDAYRTLSSIAHRSTTSARRADL